MILYKIIQSSTKIGPNHIILYFEADEGKQYKIGKITHKSTQLDDKITQSALKT